MILENFLQDQRKWYSIQNNDELYDPKNRSDGEVIRNYVIQGAIGLSSFLAPIVLKELDIELSNTSQIAIYIPGSLAIADSLAKNFQQGSLVGAIKNLYKIISGK